MATERERLQQDKYRALAEERERAKLALARVEALDAERKAQDKARAAIQAVSLPLATRNPQPICALTHWRRELVASACAAAARPCSL